jgi:hypothetical protein
MGRRVHAGDGKACYVEAMLKSSPFADALQAELDLASKTFLERLENEGFRGRLAKFCQDRDAAVAGTLFLSVMTRCETIWRWCSMGLVTEAEAAELERQELAANEIVHQRMKGC